MFWTTSAVLLVGFISQPETVNTRIRFEAVAGNLRFFPAYPYGEDVNSSGKIPKDWLRGWHEIRDEVLSPKHQPKDLIALLKHENPRVRTLALFALFEREDPQYLPHMASLLDDQEKTAPMPEHQVAIALGHPRPPLRLNPQRIGDIAKLMVRLWLEPTGYRHQNFKEYWAARKDRSYCAGWFAFRRYRIENVHRHVKNEESKRLEALCKDIDQLPQEDRDWTTLILATKDYYHPGFNPIDAQLTTEEELRKAARRLGPEKLLAFLQDKKISDDPDLAPDKGGMRRDNLKIWILEHADQMLRPQDADAVLDLEKEFFSVWCAIGAAKLQPQKAEKIIRKALYRFHSTYPSHSRERAYLAANLLVVAKKNDIPFLVNWFYAETVDPQPHTTQTQVFLTYIRNAEVPFQKKLAQSLIAHKGLSKLDYQSLRALVKFVNSLNQKPIVDPQKLFRHSLPPTEEDEREFDRWRQELRKWTKK